ncbi:MAG: serine/threonine-protein kinase [Actinomycetota bacterium]
MADASRPAILDVPDLSDPVEIGEGGFGLVYRAQQADLGRDVAVKVLKVRPDTDTLTAFRREARVLGSLSAHPNIVSLYAATVTESGYPYMIMEYASGGSLHDRLVRDGPLDWRAAFELGIAVSGALEAAHARGIVHRDIKPPNIFWSDHGVPLLADFGIALLTDATRSKAGISGSIEHASPEQLSPGIRVDARTDIYSLASSLYQLIDGHPAFMRPGDSKMLTESIGRIASLDPAAIVGVPANAMAVIQRAMAKVANQRTPDAATLARELQAALDERPQAGSAPPTMQASGAADPREPAPPPPNVATPAPGPAPPPPGPAQHFAAPAPMPTATPPVDLYIDGIVDARLVTSSGFSDVYRAYDTNLGHVVAVRVRRSGDEPLSQTERSRTITELEQLRRASAHPAMLTLHRAHFAADAPPSLITDLVEGGSLEDLLERSGPLSAEWIVWYGVQVVDALITAHRYGVLHGDVKPTNILLDRDGNPRLDDFCIIERIRAAERGSMFGTPRYMAPELFDQGSNTVSTDAYALGATLHALATGHAPFAAEDFMATMRKATTERPADLRLVGIDDPLASLIEALMAKRPEHRPDLAHVHTVLLQRSSTPRP